MIRRSLAKWSFSIILRFDGLSAYLSPRSVALPKLLILLMFAKGLKMGFAESVNSVISVGYEMLSLIVPFFYSGKRRFAESTMYLIEKYGEKGGGEGT